MKQRRFVAILGAIFLVGAFLRLDLLPSQILLDDEWHSINAVVGKTFLEVLTQFNPDDNSSPPFNLYSLALLKAAGLSEMGLRLPFILAGLLMLILPPLLVKKVFNARVALIFAAFLATAPFLIFYSRYARAYGWVALLCFSALMLAHLWLTTGLRKYAAAFVGAAAIAVYAHPLSIVAVVVPFLVASFFRQFVRRAESTATTASLKSIVAVALTLGAFLLLLLWPALRESGRLPWGKGTLTAESLVTAATLLSGTSFVALNLLFFALCAGGLFFLVKDKASVGLMFLLTITGYLVLLVASHPQGVHRGAVVLRYMIVAVPIALLAVSFALDRLFAAKPWIGWVTGAGLLIGLFATGPLPALVAGPNNFTNHSAFQGSYQKHDWGHSEAHAVYPDFSISASEVPSFYRWLSAQPDIQAIVEYPFDICDYNNLFYYYQHFHRKQVLAGYRRSPDELGYRVPATSGEAQYAIGMLTADQILSRFPAAVPLRFRNMVDLDDRDALSRCGAEVVVLHKYLVALKIMPGEMGTIPVHWSPVDYFRTQFIKDFGPPLYESDQLVCFRIMPPPPK